MKTQIMCEIWRGSYLESVHSGTAVICDKNQKLVAVGGAKVVMVDYDRNLKASVPQEVKKRILNFEKTKVEIV